ncbi:MAG: hypothetical protein M0019_09375 [Actinomycetota bacterium]|nr:hypothetical protein [Actinomycetota bacterium]
MGDLLVILGVIVAVALSIKFIDFCDEIVLQSQELKATEVERPNVEL